MDKLLPGIITRIGDDHYPGTSRSVEAWPGFAPGDRGTEDTAQTQAVLSAD